MTLDDLAAAVAGAEPEDIPGMGRIHEILDTMRKSKELPDAADALLAQATQCVEQIILRDCPDSAEAIRKLTEQIASIQRLCETGASDCDIVTPPAPTSADLADPAAQSTAPPQANAAPAGDGRPQQPVTPVAAAADSLASDPALLAEFVTESMEHLERAEAALLDLETNPDNPEGINLIFRAFHTVKGTSGFLGFTQINAVAHKAETLLDQARKGEIQLAGGYADLTLEATDMLKRLVGAVSDGSGGVSSADAADVDALIAKLDSPEDVTARPQDSLRVGDILVARGLVKREAVEDAALNPTAEKLGTRLVQAGAAQPRDVLDALRTQRQAAGAPVADTTLRVSMDRLDKLINMVGELVIAQAMVSQDSVVRTSDSQALSRKVSQLDKITRELQDLTLSMRMVPLKGTFQKMARLVRDVAKKSGKDVHFLTEGEETEIDRNMVDSIGDPLVHMMRNAVDHGIEPPDDRIKRGKDPKGAVSLRAYHEAGKVVIEIHDDGRGIDPQKIRAKAVQRGIIEPDRELSEAEAYDLLFAPGFSTAEKVTDVSGRGVGMDVVKKNVEALRGRAEIRSTLGKGSTFSIRLPLTLGIIDGMLLRVGVETYILPTVSIEQAFRPDAAAISTVKGQGEIVMLRGKLIPLFRLYRLFGVPGACEDPVQALLVVVEHEGQRCALLADALLGQQQVVIKSLGTALGEIDGVSGAAILGDGRVGLILDVGGVLRVARGIAAVENE